MLPIFCSFLSRRWDTESHLKRYSDTDLRSAPSKKGVSVYETQNFFFYIKKNADVVLACLVTLPPRKQFSIQKIVREQRVHDLVKWIWKFYLL